MSGNKAKTKKAAPAHAWKPGQSGNPNGRPKKDPEADAILKAATPLAAQRLVDLLRSESDKVALAAANAILDRTQGKPETSGKLALTDPDGAPLGSNIQTEIRRALLERKHEPARTDA